MRTKTGLVGRLRNKARKSIMQSPIPRQRGDAYIVHYLLLVLQTQLKLQESALSSQTREKDKLNSQVQELQVQ